MGFFYIPDIRSYSDQGDSTLFRISVLIQTWGFYNMPDVRSYSDLGGMPDIRSYSDLGGSTICRITVLIQTWGEFVLLYFEYLFLFRPWGFYYNPDICSYSDQGFYIIPDIRSYLDQGGFTIFRISGLIQTRWRVLQYSGYLV